MGELHANDDGESSIRGAEPQNKQQQQLRGGEPEVLSLDEASKRAGELVTEIFRGFDFLGSFLRRYETKLRKKWKDMSVAKRKTLVKSVEPELSLKRIDALYFYFQEGLEGSVQVTKESALLPYLNVEDCCKDASQLLGLVHFRGRMLPERFFHSDLESLDAAFTLKLLTRIIVEGHGLQINGGRNGYGKFVDMNKITSQGRGGGGGGGVGGKDGTHQGGLSASVSCSPMALLVLEAQSCLMSFLLRWASETILPKEFDAQDPVEDSPLGPPDLMTSLMRQNMGTKKGWSTLAENNWLKPYGMPPASLSFLPERKRLRRVVLAMKGYSQDRLHVLRTDPEFLYHELQSYDEHTAERIASAQNHKLHPELEKPLYYDRLVGNLVKETFCDVVLWSLMEEEFQYLTQLLDGPLADPELIKRAQRLAFLTRKALYYNIKIFDRIFKSSPEFRTNFSRKNNKTGEPCSAELKIENPDSLFDSNRELWILNRLVGGGKRAVVMSSLLDELDLAVQGNPKIASKFSPLVLNGISKLSALNEVLTGLSFFHLETASGDLTSEEIKNLEYGKWSDLQELMSKPTTEYHLGKFAVPFSRFSGVPSSPVLRTKKRNSRVGAPENSAAPATMAVENLKAFWKAVKEQYDSELVSSLIDGRMLNFDVAAMVPVQDDPDKENQDEQDMAAAIPSPVQRYSHGRKKSVHFPEKLETSVKIMHKPADSQHPPPPPTPTLKTPTRASFDNPFNNPLDFSPMRKKILSEKLFKLACRLFPQTDEQNPQRETGLVEWKDFLSFMIALEFDVEKKRGSMWQFSKLTGMLVTSLCFPAPESNKLTHLETRNIGRRLTRRLGLDISYFMLG